MLDPMAMAVLFGVLGGFIGSAILIVILRSVIFPRWKREDNARFRAWVEETERQTKETRQRHR